MLTPIVERFGRSIARLRPGLVEGLIDNLSHVRPEANDEELRELAAEGIGSYARYWLDSLRLPSLSATAIDEGFAVEGYEYLAASRDAGFGPIMVLPHLGGWEWAAAWLGRVAEIPVTAVVERLDPPDVYEWFVGLRSSYGINVVPLGDPDAMARLLKAVRERHVVCLVADRDIGATGIEVEFFGSTTTLPAGPALLARRSGAPILPTAVFFEGSKRVCRIEAPIRPDSDRPLRPSVAETTQRVAGALEALIAQAPGQWHVLQPNWPTPIPGGG